jgi:uncharacterized protein YndB with AHSA1/START domain
MPVVTKGFAHRVDIMARPETVWAAMVDSAQLSLWLGRDARVRARAGGVWSITFDEDLLREATIDVFEPARRLRLIYLVPPGLPDFDGAVVEDYLLESDGSGTVLRVLGSGIPELPDWELLYRRLRSGTERALGRLKVLVERGARSR